MLDLDAILYDPCLTSSIILTESILPALVIPFDEGEIQFDQNSVDVTPPIDTCTLEFTVTTTKGEQLSSSYQFDAGQTKLSWSISTDQAPADQHLRISVNFLGYTNAQFVDFTIEGSGTSETE